MKRKLIYLLGDIAVLTAVSWITSFNLYTTIGLLYLFGFYDKRIVLKKKLFREVLLIQTVALLLEAPFLGLVNISRGITYLILSSLFLSFWRRGRIEKILLIGEGKAAEELSRALSAERASEELDGYQIVIYQEEIDQLYEEFFGKVSQIGEVEVREGIIYSLFKRLFDIVISLFIFSLTLWLYPIIIIMIKRETPGPAIIAQDRVGQNGKKIKLFKFRSMTVSDRGVWVKKEDERITRVGAFLRKTRLDELPQLYNILRGEMSLIGPRPDIEGLYERLVKEIPYYRTRTLVKPGLSGWAQVNQKEPPQSVEETEERLLYDLYYIKKRTTILDIRIALKTIAVLLSRSGA